MNLLTFFSVLGALLPLIDRVASAPIANESECSQKVRVGGEFMWITDVLSNHKCQMGPLFNAAMGRGNSASMFDKLFISSSATRSVCAGLKGLLEAAEQKNMMDAMCFSLGKNWDLVFCKAYYTPGESGEVLKSLAKYGESSFLPPEVQLVISSLATMDQSSCYGACGGGKGFICKAFVGLAVALLNPSPSVNDGDAGKIPQMPDTIAGVPMNQDERLLPQAPAAGDKSLASQKVPAGFGPSFEDGKSEDKDPKGFGFGNPSNEKADQPGVDVNPALGKKPGPVAPEGFAGNGRQVNGSMLSRFDPNVRRPFPNPNMPAGQGQPQPGFGQPQPGFGQPQTGFGQPQTGLGQPQTGLGQPQTGLGQPQTGFGLPQTGARQPQTGFQQPQATGDQSVPGVGRPQTNPGQPQTNPGQPRTNPGQPQTNPGQPQTTQNRPPGVEGATRPSSLKEPPKEDDESDKVTADDDKQDKEDEKQGKDDEKQDKDDENPDEDKEESNEDDEEHELFDKENGDDDDDEEDYEEDKSQKEKMTRPQFENVPVRPGGKLAPAPNKGPVPPPRPPEMGKPPGGVVNIPNKDHLPPRPPEMGKPPGGVVNIPNRNNPRPPAFKVRPPNAPAPVEIKSVDSAPVEEDEYHGHGPFFFLTILCVAVASLAVCYCCITNKMRIRETVHILLTSKGSKARREYR